MTYSARKTILRGRGAVLAASAATFAAAVVFTTSGPAWAADQNYRFEMVQVASAGLGSSDATVRLVRATDGTPVADAEISGNAIGTSAEQPGYRRFHVDTLPGSPRRCRSVPRYPGPCASSARSIRP